MLVKQISISYIFYTYRGVHRTNDYIQAETKTTLYVVSLPNFGFIQKLPGSYASSAPTLDTLLILCVWATRKTYCEYLAIN